MCNMQFKFGTSRDTLLKRYNPKNEDDSCAKALQGIFKDFWNIEAINELISGQSLNRFFSELNIFLAHLENCQDKEKADATLLDMSADCREESLLRLMYNNSQNGFGEFAMRCMRIDNTLHAFRGEGKLNVFKKQIFDMLDIKIEGDWKKCVTTQNFKSTSFSQGTLYVDAPDA